MADIWVTNGALPRVSEREHVSEQVKVGVVTSNFLPLFCTKPELGRFFSPEDEASRATEVLIISYGVWSGVSGRVALSSAPAWWCGACGHPTLVAHGLWVFHVASALPLATTRT